MKKRKRGFTLSELLAVVGIIAVLLAAAIPGIVAIDRKTKQKELDDYAREIFVEAQNQLLARNTVGTAAKIDAEAEKDGTYCWLVNNDAVRLLLEGDAIDIIKDDARCVLKYNPTTATVLEVYYSNKPMDISQIRMGTYSGDSAKELRKDSYIGYFYGSDTISGKIAHMPTPLLEITNSEELTVKVTVPAFAPVSGSFNDVSQEVTITVQELNSAGENVAGNSFVLKRESSATAVGYSKDLLLDSVENDSFKTISGGTITPGADVLVTASVVYKSGGDSSTVYLASDASAKVNSLFASVSNGTASIACGRHLQNLSTGFSGVSGITAAVQTDQIIWRDAHTAKFAPIFNTQLKSYDGKNNEILRLDVNMTSAGNAGVFAALSNAELENIRLCDIDIYNPSVVDSADSGTGALAGLLTNCRINNCRVYNSSRVFGNTSYVGGLIGKVSDCTVKGCFANVFRVKSDCGRTVGGLLGCAERATITNSYSNIGVMTADTPSPVWAGDSGLISEGVNGGFTNGTVGGLVGYGSASTAEHCYVCGVVLVANNANAYFGNSSVGSTASDCYSLLSYNEGSGVSFTAPVATNLWADSAENQKKACDVNATGLLSWANNAGTGWVYNKESYATNINWVALVAPYPYPMIEGVPHYGDWPAPF